MHCHFPKILTYYLDAPAHFGVSTEYQVLKAAEPEKVVSCTPGLMNVPLMTHSPQTQIAVDCLETTLMVFCTEYAPFAELLLVLLNWQEQMFHPDSDSGRRQMQMLVGELDLVLQAAVLLKGF